MPNVCERACKTDNSHIFAAFESENAAGNAKPKWPSEKYVVTTIGTAGPSLHNVFRLHLAPARLQSHGLLWAGAVFAIPTIPWMFGVSPRQGAIFYRTTGVRAAPS